MKNKDKPLLSVIVPMYNVEKYLEECIESIQAQNIDEMEIICIDDGSTDNTYAIAEKLCENDPRIIIIRQENQGQSAARNEGIRAASGEYLIFIDSDDMWEKGTVKKILEFAIKERAELVSFKVKELLFENENMRTCDNKEAYYHIKNNYPECYDGKELFAQMIQNNDFVDSAWLIIINRKWLVSQKLFFYTGIVYEDALFAVQCYLTAKRVFFLPIDMYIYRIRNNSTMTSTLTLKNLESRIVVLKEIMKIFFELSCKSKSVIMALKKYVKFIKHNICCVFEMLIQETPDELSKISASDKAFMEIIGINNVVESERNECINNFNEAIHQAESIIIYGAGKVGCQVMEYIKNIGHAKKVECFAVSSAMSDNRILCDKNVRCINELINFKDALLIVSVGESMQSEMKGMAKNIGFKNLVSTNFILEIYMERQNRKMRI